MNASRDDTGARARPQPRKSPLFENRAKLWRGSPLRPLRYGHLLLALVALGLLWRVVRYAMAFPVWGDEAFVAVNFFYRDFAGMIDPLIYGQIVPLVFMWLELAAARTLGYSELALRLVPFVAGVLGLLLYVRFARQVLKRRAALLAIGIFAAAYYTVRHTAEIKPYSFDLLVALGLLSLGWSLYRSPGCPRRWAGLTALALVAPWTSYPSVFALATLAPLLGRALLDPARRSRAALLGWLGFCLAGGGSFVAMYLIYGHPHARAAARLLEIDMWARTFPPLTEPLRLVGWFFYMHLGRMMAYPVGGAAPGSLVTFVLVTIGAAHLWRSGRRDLLWLLLGPLAASFVAACLHKYPYGGSARTTQYLAPSFCLLAGLGLYVVIMRTAAGPRRHVLFKLACVIFAAIAVGGTIQDLLHPYKSERTRASHRAVLRVARESPAGQRWIVFNAKDRVAYAPFLGELRGSGAQFVFNVLRFAPGPIEFAPPPESVSWQPDERSLRVLAYRSSRSDIKDEGEFAAWDQRFSELLDRYTGTLARRLHADLRSESIFIYDRHGRREALEVYTLQRPPANRQQ